MSKKADLRKTHSQQQQQQKLKKKSTESLIIIIIVFIRINSPRLWIINVFWEKWTCQAGCSSLPLLTLFFSEGLIVRKCCLTVGWGHGLTSECGSVESDDMLLRPIHSGPFYFCISRSRNLGQRTMHSLDRSRVPEPFSCSPLTLVPEPSHPNTQHVSD